MNYSRIVKLLLFCLLSPFFSAVSLAARSSASAELQLKLQAPVRGYHLRATNFVEGLTQVASHSQISLQLKDASVEDVLDALAVASARKIWIVTFSDDPTLTPTGFRRTLTLWSNSPIPDNEQPVWDLLHWGGPTPPLLAKN